MFYSFYQDTSDLNFVVHNNGLSGRALIKNGFAYMWAGARANKGAKGGKVGYEVKVSNPRLLLLMLAAF